MGKRFSEVLRAQAEPIWEAIFAHPFLRELEAGILSLERFRFYICQDFRFLAGFARAVAMALSKAPDSETMLLLSERVPVPVERGMHRKLFSMLDIDEAEAEIVELAPTNRAYVNHLLSTAAMGSVNETAAALLPCPWTYHEIGQRLGEFNHAIYKTWASIYQQGFLAASVEAWRSLVNAAPRETGDTQLRHMEETFLTSSRYEYMFWEMAYCQETWPV